MNGAPTALRSAPEDLAWKSPNNALEEVAGDLLGDALELLGGFLLLWGG